MIAGGLVVVGGFIFLPFDVVCVRLFIWESLFVFYLILGEIQES